MRLVGLSLIALGILADTIASQWLLDALQYSAFIVLVLFIILLALGLCRLKEGHRKDSL